MSENLRPANAYTALILSEYYSLADSGGGGGGGGGKIDDGQIIRAASIALAGLLLMIDENCPIKR